MAMPDWEKRVAKERASDFGPGENLRAATFFQGRGTLAGLIKFALVREVGGNLGPSQSVADLRAAAAGRKTMAEAKEGHNTFEGSIAAQFPDDKGVVAFTNERLIVFGYSQGVFKTKITDVVATISLPDLVGWSYRTSKVSSVLEMAFSDGSNVGIELPRANKPDKFAATLGIPAAEV